MPDEQELSRERARSKLGATVRGKYRLDAILGIGGMATVFVATHRNAKQFALKMLHPELSQVADIRGRFLREGYVANTVGDDGAVAVLDDDVAEDGGAFLVMELLRGRSLDAVWDRLHRALPVPAAVAIADQLLGVLAAAHDKGIVHRDIKPANLFLTTGGKIKVLDFGVARLRDTASRVTTTESGSALGTPAFMAPENALGKASLVDARSDLWAVGATVFTLLTGSLVHEAETLQELLVFAATRPARSLASARADVPRPIVEVIDRALAKEKEDRWPNARAMREALRRASVAAFAEEPAAAQLAPLLPLAQPDPCISEDALAALAEGRVTPAERAAIESHLDACANCRAVVRAVRGEGSTLARVDRALASALRSPVEVLGVAPTVPSNADAIGTARPVSREASGERAAWTRPRVWVGAGVVALGAIALGAVVAIRRVPPSPVPAMPPTEIASHGAPPPVDLSPLPPPTLPSDPTPTAPPAPAAPAPPPKPRPAALQKLPPEPLPAKQDKPAKPNPWDHL